MSKTTVSIDLIAFDKMIKHAKAQADSAEMHTLDQIIKTNELNLLEDVDKLIDRSEKKPAKKVVKAEKVEDTKESNESAE